MIISHKHKFIFIKTRKTAGSSIEKYLYNYLGQHDICTGSIKENTPALNSEFIDGHISASTIQKQYPFEFKNYFKFAVERNPWDKVVSYYFYQQHKKEKRTKGGFDAFVEHYGKNVVDWSMYTNNDKVAVDQVIRYENLHQTFLKIPIPYNCELLTTKVKAEFRKEKDYKKFYTNKSIEIVSNLFNKEIDMFSYQFN